MPTRSPITTPSGIATSHHPTSATGPPRSATYGAATASGATANVGTSQPSNMRRRSGRWANTVRRPWSESRSKAGRSTGSSTRSWYRRPTRVTTAETRNEPASIRIAPRGESTISNAPPMALPTICALWPAIRKSDRAGTYAPSGTILGRSAPRPPPERLDAVPTATSSARSTGTGTPGSAITATRAAHARSQPASSRRRGTRSTTAESSAPETRYGRKPRANVSDASSDEPVRS